MTFVLNSESGGSDGMSTQAPVAVELPAVIDAAQTALFVAAEEHRRAAVRAERARPGRRLPLAVAERDEVFAEQADANRRAVRSPAVPLESAAGIQ